MPKPDLGEATYKGSGRLAGKRAIITGGDSGIGAAVAIAFAREVVVDAAVAELGGLEILVNNAAYQQATPNFEDITIEEWDKTFQTIINGLFYITKCAVPHMKAGCAIVNTSSINAKKPMASLLPYSAIKAAIANFTLGLAQSLADKKIRVNAVLPGPIWTTFIRRAWRRSWSRGSARRRRSGVRASRPSLPRPTSCWPPTNRATRRAHWW